MSDVAETSDDDPEPTPDDDPAPTPDDVLHDARIELDQWRASFRMDPLER